MSSTSARNSARSVTKVDAEQRMVRQREKEHDRQVKWGSQVQYYKSFEKTNNKFEEWTSPRYYATNNQLIDTQRKQRERKETLEKRREKLRKLLGEEQRSHEIELMVRKNRPKSVTGHYDNRSVPLELLKEVHLGVKLAEQDRKRHEAELALYQHWKNNNPVLREQRRVRSAKDVKLSWLDQQVEKRIEKERAEEDSRRMLAEKKKRMEQERAKEEEFKQETARKNEQLRKDLEKQMEELNLKQKRSEELRAKEDEEIGQLAVLATIVECRDAELKRKKDRELALENLKQHKLKLKQKAEDVQENLEREKELIGKLIESDVADKMEDETKKCEVKRAMAEFLKFARDQQALEVQRRKHFSFVFDSEAKLVYERQQAVWLEEQRARDALLKDVLGAVKEQIEEKVRWNKDQQRETLEERKAALQLVEMYDEDMRKNKEEEERKRNEWKRGIEEQIREKEAGKKTQEILEKQRLDVELEAVRKEEERLRKEIAEIQRKQGPIRHTRSRIVF